MKAVIENGMATLIEKGEVVGFAHPDAAPWIVGEELKPAIQRGLDRWWNQHVTVMNSENYRQAERMIDAQPSAFSRWPQRF